jgi:tetratricopeptide (TPR) repeat protein
MPAPSVFISYSHKDEVWKDRLVTHLGVLQNQGLLQTWTDRDIGAGDEWFEEIRNAMNAARVAVLLISASSLTSKFILHTEIPHLLERRAREGMAVFPVLCKACLWQEIPWLAKLQARPRDDKALASFSGNRLESELVKIAKEILEIARNGSTAIAGSSSTTTSTVSSLPALHQIPAPPADFTGRAEDLSALKSALTGGGTGAIFGLRGMGGVGKTTLALKLAQELESLYPDAQLYLDLKGVDPHPLSATQAMAHVVRSFHPDIRLPESETEMAGLYRSVLHGKRALLLMDNARDRPQVELLIPPTGSILLVTSRFRFALPGLIVRDLDELPNEDACNLLLRIAPRIGSAANEIAQLCGRLPLALRLAGSALAERPNLSSADYARRLKEGKERLDPVEASLNLSYELLSEDRRRLWRLLAVFPGTFDAPAAAAVWDLEVDSVSDVLSELVRSSLVEWEDKDELYRLHDLSRSFVDRWLEGTEKEVARKRHAEHYLGVLRAAKDLYKKGGESILQGLRLFNTEWGNIQEGQAWAARHFSEDAEASRICSSYPDAGAFLLDLRQHPRDRIRWRELALAAARQRKDRSAEAVHLGNLGIAYRNLGEPRRAIELYEQWLAIARELGDRRWEGQAFNSLGLAYADLGDPRRAIELYEQQLAIAREIGDRNGEANALGNLGLAYADLGEPRRAIEFHEQALAIDREIGDRRGEGQDLGNLGIAYKNLGEPRRAIEFYEQRLPIAREIGDRLGEANASWNLGLALESEGDLARAAALMQVRVDYEREIGHPDAEKPAARVAVLRARIAEQNP